MTKLEYDEIVRRTQAMTPQETEVVLANIPDGYLLREVIGRYSKLLDIKSAYERVPDMVDRAFSRDYSDDLVGWT